MSLKKYIRGCMSLKKYKSQGKVASISGSGSSDWSLYPIWHERTNVSHKHGHSSDPSCCYSFLLVVWKCCTSYTSWGPRNIFQFDSWKSRENESSQGPCRRKSNFKEDPMLKSPSLVIVLRFAANTEGYLIKITIWPMVRRMYVCTIAT
jgi:hypothetical protein